MDPADQDIVNRAFANFGKVLAAYERRLLSGNAPFDRYVAGDTGAMGEAAKRGLKLFIGKAACVACHEGPTFSDEEFHVTGVPQIGEHVLESDGGRFDAIPFYLSWDFNTAGPYSDDPSIDRTRSAAQDEALLGAFRTKGLRSVADTAPFMHTGHVATLQEAVELYNRGGAGEGFAGVKDDRIQPLNLTAQEIQDLVAFLEALTGEPVPEELRRDPSAP
jgi:cytochrome c peroxidase